MFSVFSPPTRRGCKPRVAFYVYSSFLSTVSILPRFFARGDDIVLDLLILEAFFNTSTTKFSIINSYSSKGRSNNSHSVPVDMVFPAAPQPTLTLGDLNIHHPTSDPFRVFKEDEIATSTPYFDRARSWDTPPSIPRECLLVVLCRSSCALAASTLPLVVLSSHHILPSGLTHYPPLSLTTFL